MKIGVFGSSIDPEVQVLQRRIINRGVECLTFNFSQFPDDLSLAITNDAILANDFNLLELDTAYLRSSGGRYPNLMRFDELGNLMPIRFHSRAESKRKHQELIQYLKKEKSDRTIRQAVIFAFQCRRPLINPLRPNSLHRLKPFLFHYLRKHGVPVPEFIVASAGDWLLRFSKRNANLQAKTVAKPLAGIFKTELQTEKEWERGFWKIRGAFYQTFIDGDTIRCYVLNDRVIAAAKILFHGTVDSSLSQTGIEVVDLPPQAVQIARTTARILDTRFCGIDLMREKRTDKYFVIDCNFSPMFVNFARLSKIDIPAKIAEYLIQLARQDPKNSPKGVPLLREAKELLTSDKEIRQKLGL